MAKNTGFRPQGVLMNGLAVSTAVALAVAGAPVTRASAWLPVAKAAGVPPIPAWALATLIPSTVPLALADTDCTSLPGARARSAKVESLSRSERAQDFESRA
jgi:hypothetical protein